MEQHRRRPQLPRRASTRRSTAYAAAEAAYEKLGMSAETREDARQPRHRAVRGRPRPGSAGCARRGEDDLHRGRAIGCGTPSAPGTSRWHISNSASSSRHCASSPAREPNSRSSGAHAESARLQAIAARIYLTAGLHVEARGEAEAAAEFLRRSGNAARRRLRRRSRARWPVSPVRTTSTRPSRGCGARSSSSTRSATGSTSAQVRLAEADLAAPRRAACGRRRGCVGSAVGELRDGGTGCSRSAWAIDPAGRT